MQTSSSSSSSSSSITLHSLMASSTDSSPNSLQSQSQSQSQSPDRCLGLNLLVKAIHQVTAGSIIGVPYIQRRIITRRKRPLQFNYLLINSLSKPKPKPKPKTKPKRQRQTRLNITMPCKYTDSVLQPLTPKRRSQRSIKINATSQ